MGSLAEAAARVAAAIDEYKFNEAAGAIYHFTWGTFCDWFIEFAKPIFSGADAAAAAETRAVTAWALGEIVLLLHPLAPFVTEELWRHFTGGKSGLLIGAPWPSYPAGLIDRDAMAEMEWVVELISAIRSARAEMNVPPASAIAASVVESGGQGSAWIARHAEAIKDRARLSTLEAERRDARSAIQVVAGGVTLSLDLAGVVDIAKERARLAKEAAGVEEEIGKIARKLGNEQFLAKAKPEVVEEQRERLAEAEAARARLRAALARIAA